MNKEYEFTVTWGIQTTTDDAEGKILSLLKNNKVFLIRASGSKSKIFFLMLECNQSFILELQHNKYSLNLNKR